MRIFFWGVGEGEGAGEEEGEARMELLVHVSLFSYFNFCQDLGFVLNS